MARVSSAQVRHENNTDDPSTVTSLNLSLRSLSDVSLPRDFKNLGRLDLSCNGLTTLQELSLCTNLKWLSVAQNKLKRLRGIEGLHNLTVLNASKNMLEAMDEVRTLSELRALILNDNEISSICLLDQLQYLNTLVLSRNPIHDIGLALKNSTSITKLSLSNCKIQMIGSSLTIALNLKELRLADNEITGLPSELARNIKLQNLDLGKNLIMRLSDIKVLSELPNLRNLNLQGNPLAENPKLIKKIWKLVSNLQIFNAKPLERWNQIKQTSENDTSVAVKGVRSPADASASEAKNKVHRKTSEPEVITSGKKNKRSDVSRATYNSAAFVEDKTEKKKKKAMVLETLQKNVISIINEDGKSHLDDNESKEHKSKKEKKKDRPTEFDDGETSFMDLILSGDVDEERAGKPLGSQATWDEKLLGGVIVDHRKKKKAKKSRNGLPTKVVFPSQVSDVGAGGPSAWDD